MPSAILSGSVASEEPSDAITKTNFMLSQILGTDIRAIVNDGLRFVHVVLHSLTVIMFRRERRVIGNSRAQQD